MSPHNGRSDGERFADDFMAQKMAERLAKEPPKNLDKLDVNHNPAEHERANELHHEAMSYADKARALEREAEAMWLLAYHSEAAAANRCVPDAQPTHAVLHRSAGWLALKAKQPKEAMRHAEAGLKHVQHGEMREELSDLLWAARKAIENA